MTRARNKEKQLWHSKISHGIQNKLVVIYPLTQTLTSSRPQYGTKYAIEGVIKCTRKCVLPNADTHKYINSNINKNKL